MEPCSYCPVKREERTRRLAAERAMLCFELQSGLITVPRRKRLAELLWNEETARLIDLGKGFQAAAIRPENFHALVGLPENY